MENDGDCKNVCADRGGVGLGPLLAPLGAALALLSSAAPAEARPRRAHEHTAEAKLDALETAVGATTVPIVDACAGDAACASSPLSRFHDKLAARKEGGAGVRVLLLGDSHVASDFITGYLRDALQDRFGNGGRGLVHGDQRLGYGGRLTKRPASMWTEKRVVDRGGPGHRYGLFAQVLTAKRKGAWSSYAVLEEDASVTVWSESKDGRGFAVTLDGEALEPEGPAEGGATRYVLPPSEAERRQLKVVAEGPGARLYGLGFHAAEPGLELSAIGPVGADAAVYLQMDGPSFSEELSAYAPDLVVLMVGGNDALKVRKKWKGMKEIEEDHRKLVAFLREAAPGADILLLSPMDAGQKKGERVVGKPLIEEMRNLQAKLAEELGLGFWDTWKAMGGEGAIGRWVKAGAMNADLVHPKKPGADLLGRLMATALLTWADTKPL